MFDRPSLAKEQGNCQCTADSWGHLYHTRPQQGKRVLGCSRGSVVRARPRNALSDHCRKLCRELCRLPPIFDKVSDKDFPENAPETAPWSNPATPQDANGTSPQPESIEAPSPVTGEAITILRTMYVIFNIDSPFTPASVDRPQCIPGPFVPTKNPRTSRSRGIDVTNRVPHTKPAPSELPSPRLAHCFRGI